MCVLLWTTGHSTYHVKCLPKQILYMYSLYWDQVIAKEASKHIITVKVENQDFINRDPTLPFSLNM